MQDTDHGLSRESRSEEMFTNAVGLIRRARVENNPSHQQVMLQEAEQIINDALRMTIPSIVRGEVEIGFQVKPSDGLYDEQQWKTV